MQRRAFISAATVLTPAALLHSAAPKPRRARDDQHLPADLVFSFVRTAHLDLKRTDEMITDEPRLMRASYEWTPGDFETGFDGAAHTGSVDIVRLLLERGAAHTIFAAAVLGEIDVIRAVVQRHPEVIHAPGPHRITLLDHAIAGGEPAADVRAYLEALDAPTSPPPLDAPVPAPLAAQIAGTYRIEADGQKLTFRIYREGEHMHIDAGQRGTLRLQYQGQGRFVLEGTPAQLQFDLSDDPCRRTLLSEGRPIGQAHRVES